MNWHRGGERQLWKLSQGKVKNREVVHFGTECFGYQKEDTTITIINSRIEVKPKLITKVAKNMLKKFRIAVGLQDSHERAWTNPASHFSDLLFPKTRFTMEKRPSIPNHVLDFGGTLGPD